MVFFMYELVLWAPDAFSRALQSRTATVVTLCILAVFAVALVLRIGHVPIASGGDGVWYSESAYWLLQDGTMKRPMHQSSMGPAYRDFLPPVVTVVQALMFRLMGLSSFSMSVAPTIILALLVGVLFATFRGLDYPVAIAAGAALAPFAAEESFVRSVQARFDIYAALFVILSLVSLIRFLERRSPFYLCLSGVFCGIAVVAYYPAAIFPVAFGGLLLKWTLQGQVRGKALMGFLLGGAIPALALCLWIGRDWLLFLRYNIAAGRSYGGIEGLIAGDVSSVPFPWWSILLSLVFLGVAWASRSLKGMRRDIGIFLALVGFLFQLVMFMFSRALLPATAALAVFSTMLVCRWGAVRPQVAGRLTALFPLIGLITAGAACIGAVMAGAPGRQIEPFGSQLRAAVNASGLVVVAQAGWLPLREVIGKDRLVHLAGYSPDASKADASDWFFDPAAASRVSTLAIAPGTRERILKGFPALYAFATSPGVEGPLLVGEAAPYQLEVYRRKQP